MHANNANTIVTIIHFFTLYTVYISQSHSVVAFISFTEFKFWTLLFSLSMSHHKAQSSSHFKNILLGQQKGKSTLSGGPCKVTVVGERARIKRERDRERDPVRRRERRGGRIDRSETVICLCFTARLTDINENSHGAKHGAWNAGNKQGRSEECVI